MVLAVALAVAALAGCHRRPDPATLLADAVAYRQKNEHPAAIIQLKNLLQLQPGHAEARFLLGQSLMAVGEFKGAEPELRRAMEAGWPKEQILVPLARCMLVQGKYQDLLFEVPADALPDSADMAAVRGLALFALGRLDESRAMLERSLALSPEHPDALLGLARIEVREKRTAAAGALIERALAADPRSVDAWLLKGELQLALGKPAAAADAYEKLLATYPGNVQALLGLGSIRLAEGATDAAAKHVAQAARLAPSNPLAHYLIAVVAYRKGDAVTARQAITLALRYAPNNSQFQMLAGTIMTAQGAWADAELPLYRLLEKTPVHVQARKMYGATLIRTNRPVQALSVLLPTLELVPADSSLHAVIGDAYLRTGDVARAVTHLDKAVGGTPEKARGRSAIGLAPFVSFDLERTLEDTERAIRSYRDYAEPDRLLAVAALQAGGFDEALKAVGRIEAAHPRDAEVFVLKGTALAAKKDLAGARIALERALELDPASGPAVVRLAQVDLAENHRADARVRLDSFLARNPKNVEALVGLAVLGASGIGATNSEILEWIKRGQEQRPNDPQLQMLLVHFHLRAGDREQALAAAAQLARLGGESPDVMRVVGMTQMNAGDAAAAVRTYSGLVTAQPNSPEALRLLAEAELAATDNQAGAALLLKRALELKPGDYAALVALAEIDIRAGRLDAALKGGREARKIDPDAPRAHMIVGDALMLQGQPTLAAKAYEAALARRKSGDAAIRMHGTLDHLGKTLEARGVLEDWFKENPGDVPVRAYYGNYLLQRKQYREAAEEYERVLRSNSERADVLNNYAWVLDQIGDHRAKQYAERAAAAGPNDPAALDTLGWILVKQGDYERGIETLLRAVAVAPDSAEVRFHLAQAWLKAGNKPKAMRDLELLVSSYRNFPEMGEAKALLKELQR